MKLLFTYTKEQGEIGIGFSDTQWLVLRRKPTKHPAGQYEQETYEFCSNLVYDGKVAIPYPRRGLVYIHSKNPERDMTYYSLKYGEKFEFFKLYQGTVTERMQGWIKDLAKLGLIVDWVDHVNKTNRYA